MNFLLKLLELTAESKPSVALSRALIIGMVALLLNQNSAIDKISNQLNLMGYEVQAHQDRLARLEQIFFIEKEPRP